MKIYQNGIIHIISNEEWYPLVCSNNSNHKQKIILFKKIKDWQASFAVCDSRSWITCFTVLFHCFTIEGKFYTLLNV